MAAVDTTRESSTFWASVREALRGSHQDYTAGSLTRAIFLLAVPMVLEMLMESLFAIVDVFWVARLGADSVATIGLVESVLSLMYAVGMGLGLSATAMVARRVGEKDRDGAAAAGVQAIALGLLLGFGMGAPCLYFAPHFLRLMGASPAVLAVGTNFARITLGSCIVVLLLFLNNAVLRGAGDAAIAMRVLWLSNSINLVLDPCLIFGLGPFPRLGVTGAAVATMIGRGIGVAYQFHRLLKGGEHIRIFTRQIRLNLEVMLRLLTVSVTGVTQLVIPQIAWTILVRIVSVFGSAALASYTIGIRIIIFFILPAWGLSGAAASLVGQNLGAKQPERADESVWKTGLYNMLFLGGEGVLLFLFAAPVMRFFTHDPAIVPLGVSCLRILSLGNVGYAYGMVMQQAFNGAGDTFTPTVVNFFGFLFFEIPLAYALAFPLGLRSNGVYWAIAVAESAIAGVSVLLFRRGRWKEREI
ncbi:MAG: MATE family efflux transporter [Acidobacteriia bacterium]|nr:MATE family efflux transporter [Terriglobia bacterium]